MSNLITQAQVAATQADWSMVALTLQRLCFAESNPVEPLPETAQLVTLAIAVLVAGDFQAQWEVAKVFPVLGQAAIPPLINLLQDDEAELESRWFAARILGDLNDPVAMRALVEQLQTSEDEDLSQVVAEALANLGTPAIAALTTLLTSNDTRQFAVQALAQIHQSATVTPLLSVVADPNPTIRAIAIEALSSFHDPRIAQVLVEAVTDPAAIVRQVAIAGLSVRPELVENWNVIEVVSNCLWDLNIKVCQQSALALGKLRRDAAIPALQRALLAPNTPLALQLDLVRALSWIGTIQALNSLQSCLLCHQDQPLPLPVVQEILSLLGRWQHSDHKSSLVQTLTDALTIIQEPVLRRTIATALGHLNHPAALEPLIRLLADEDAGVRLHAIAALKVLDPTAAYTRLANLQTHQELPENLRTGVIVALREWEMEFPPQ